MWVLNLISSYDSYELAGEEAWVVKMTDQRDTEELTDQKW